VPDTISIRRRTVTRICRSDLMVVDDIGMLPAGQEAAEAFYRITDAAYERRSMTVTSNIHPAGFDTIMPKTLATATVDRLLHRAHLVITKGDSPARRTPISRPRSSSLTWTPRARTAAGRAARRRAPARPARALWKSARGHGQKASTSRTRAGPRRAGRSLSRSPVTPPAHLQPGRRESRHDGRHDNTDPREPPPPATSPQRQIP
jgi:hypothetical protein